MGKSVITKNLSDKEMLKNYKEEETFETAVTEEKTPVAPKTGKGKVTESINTAFFTPELQGQVGKALLDLKLKLFKEGIVDYTVKVTRLDSQNQVVLTAVPLVPKKQQEKQR